MFGTANKISFSLILGPIIKATSINHSVTCWIACALWDANFTDLQLWEFSRRSLTIHINTLTCSAYILFSVYRRSFNSNIKSTLPCYPSVISNKTIWYHILGTPRESDMLHIGWSGGGGVERTRFWEQHAVWLIFINNIQLKFCILQLP